jgi:hypothetical protein
MAGEGRGEVKLNEYLDDALGDVLVCGCGCGFGSRLEHWCHGEAVDVATIHAEIRSRANCAIHVLSGARCPRHNAAVARTERSQHAIACALDLALPAGWEYLDFYTLCDETVKLVTGGVGGVGKYTAQRFVHVDSGFKETWGRRWGE